MKSSITKYFIFIIFLLALFLSFKGEALAQYSVMSSPNTTGSVLTAGTDAPIANVWVRWTDNVDDTSASATHNVRYTKTDSNGNYSFPSWQDLDGDANSSNTDLDDTARRRTQYRTWIKPNDPSVTEVVLIDDSDYGSTHPGYERKANTYGYDGFGCGENTHEITAIIPTGWLGAFQGVVEDNVNNDLQNQVFPTIYYAKPPTCIVDGLTNVMAGQNYKYSAEAKGTNLTNLQLWQSPRPTLSWSRFIDKTCGSDSSFCTDSRDTSFSSAGRHYVTCNGFQRNNETTQRCTGNYQGITATIDSAGVPNSWADCGADGTLEVDVRQVNCSNLTISNSSPFDSVPMSKGYNWNKNVGYVPHNNNGFYIDDVDRYKASTGPCYGKNNCKFDTRTFLVNNNKLVESITAYGKAYNWDVNGSAYTPWTSNGANLTSVARYTAAGGPCEGKTGAGCNFDTRTFAPWGWESISAYGQYWNYNGNTLIETGNLTSVARYTAAGGPCEGKTGAGCNFDTRTFLKVGDQQWESISAYGQYWNYNGNTLIETGNLTSVARYTAAGGPCEGIEGTNCNFDTRTFMTLDNNNYIESVSASSIDKGSILTGQTDISFSANFRSTTSDFHGAISACKRNSDGSVDTNCKNGFTKDAQLDFSGSVDTRNQSYTFTEPGTYDVICRAWKSSVGECRGGSASYRLDNQFDCPGAVTVKTIKVYTKPQITSLQIGNTTTRSFSGTFGIAGSQSTQGGSNWLNPMLVTLNVNSGSSTALQSYAALYSRSSEFTARATVIDDIKGYLSTNKDAGVLLAYGKGINGNTTDKHYVYDPTNGWIELQTDYYTNICNGVCNAERTNLLYSVRAKSVANSWEVTFDKNFGSKTFYTTGYLVDKETSSLYDFNQNISPGRGAFVPTP